MEEQIQKDRRQLKNGQKEIPTDPTSFSYLPYLFKLPKQSIKLSKMSTLNILCYAEECFQNTDKQFLKSINKIIAELTKRSDIFQSTLIFLQNKRVKDDLYYWIPGHKISNIFCFLVEANPNFIKNYKQYYIEMLVTNRKYYDAHQFIQQKYPQEFQQFVLMEKDLTLFQNCISSIIWTGEDPKINSKFEQIYKFLGLEECIDLNDDIEAIVVPEVSYVDVTIDGVDMIISFEKFAEITQNNSK